MFTVGTKVVCVSDSFGEWVKQFYTALPVKDSIYVVRSVRTGISPQGQEGEIAITLVGLVNPKSAVPPFPERAFNCERFRPLLEKEDWERELDEKADCIGLLIPSQ